MVAGFLAALDRNMSYGDALNFAVACGSATAASSGLATKETIDRFYATLQRMHEDEAQQDTQKPIEGDE